jgi:hypothetical protein
MAGYGEMLFFEIERGLINGHRAAHSGKSLGPFCLAMTKTALGFYAGIRPLFLRHRHSLILRFNGKNGAME